MVGCEVGVEEGEELPGGRDMLCGLFEFRRVKKCLSVVRKRMYQHAKQTLRQGVEE